MCFRYYYYDCSGAQAKAHATGRIIRGSPLWKIPSQREVPSTGNPLYRETPYKRKSLNPADLEARWRPTSFEERAFARVQEINRNTKS